MSKQKDPFIVKRPISPKRTRKAEDGCDEWSKLYVFFSPSIRVPSPMEVTEHRALGKRCHTG
jgi:hypothetical protein